MSDVPDLPWPLCLGSFDEESCRYFLHEVGSHVVPKFPFSLGMEEVYGHILERYGLNGAPDAISLLQQFFEDDDNADGLGDDGDIWRSWRYGWRHRNDDPLNPFIPHAGNILLPAPTKSRIRQLRADNFTLQRQYRRTDTYTTVAESSDLTQETDDEVMATGRNPATPGHGLSLQPRIAGIQGPHAEPKRGSCCGRRGSCVARFDPTLAAVCEVLETQVQDGVKSQDGQKASKPSSASPMPEPPMRKSSKRLQCSNSTVVPPLPRQSEVKECSAHAVKPPTSASLSNNSEALAIDHQTITDQQPPLTPERRNRALNREARLIDGTILISRARRSRTFSQQDLETSSKRASARSSWSPSKQRESLRSNWTRELRNLLHRDKQTRRAPNDRKHRSVPVPRKAGISEGLSKMSIQDPPHPKRSSEQPTTAFGLDGSSELPAGCNTVVDVNKPLPLNPEDIVRSMSSRSHTLVSAYSDAEYNPPSAASTASSLSNSSSKKDFRSLTREMLQPKTPSPHELFPIREVDANLKAVIEPQKSPTTTSAHVSYSSVSQTNPFTNDKTPKSPRRPPPLAVTCSHVGGANAGVCPVSPEVQRQPEPTSPRPMQASTQATSSSQGASSQLERSSSARGRALQPLKPPTPDLKKLLPPKTPTKRSRSPIKKLLGLVKSGSGSVSKPEEAETPPRATTPGSASKKESLKKWGDRIRYGFLTPDEEQLRQEELLEQHNNNGGSNSSTPQQATFLVSLDPPLQAKVQSEIELIMSVTANRYLKHEARAGRLSAESITRTKELWEKLNRPQVVEYHYDSITQHNLVMSNLDRVKLHGDGAKDPIAINSTMRGWKTLAREMSVRTYCDPDSVIRKHLHDAHRVLELLGAPFVTFLAYEDMQLKTLSTISQRQKEQVGRRTGSQGRDGSNSGHSTPPHFHRRNFSDSSRHHYHHQHDYSDYPITAFQLDKISLSPSPAPFPQGKARKVTDTQGAVMSLPTNLEHSRDRHANSRLGRTDKSG